MLRGFWQTIKETIYNSVSSLFYTQEEIDENIEDTFTTRGITYTYDTEDLPSGSKRRKHNYFNHLDAIKYIEDGIPKEYVIVLILPDWDSDGDTVYQVWVISE